MGFFSKTGLLAGRALARGGTLLDRAVQGLFSYHAADSSPRRAAPKFSQRSEDAELHQIKRSTLVSGTRDLQRNMAAGAWAIRRHLDYVSTFNFQSKTGDEKTDRRIEELVGWWSKRRNCDAARRHPFGRFLRLLEGRRTVDGDVLVAKLVTGHLQAIEGDRIRTPYGPWGVGQNPVNADRIFHGVEVDDAGANVQYYVCDRDKWGQMLTQNFHQVPAEDAWLLGYFDRFDQVRGITPLSSGLNAFQDMYEGVEYALARAKVLQLFGLVFTRKESGESIVTDAGDAGAQPAFDPNDPFAQIDAGQGPRYKVDLDKGIFNLDLNDGDDAKFLESGQPSSQFKEFMLTAAMLALKSLDLPYCAFDESHTNFYGSKSAWIQYFVSACQKRRDLIELLDDITGWKLAVWVATGLLQLPAAWTIQDLRWDWIPSANTAWINPLQEIQADLVALKMGCNTRTRILRDLGIEFRDLIEELDAEEKLLKSKGLPVDLASLLAKAGVPTGVDA